MMDRVLGVLGGGQLGRMLTEAASNLGVKVLTLDAESAPAMQINASADHVIGSFTDPKAIRQLAQQCDVLTVEIEHVNTDVLEDLAQGAETRDDWRLIRSTKVEVQPSWRTIRVIQDKYKQKEHLISHGIATAKSIALETGSPEEVVEIGRHLGYPLMLKSRTEAYDGRGNHPIKSPKDIPEALAALGDRPLYAEQWANFQMELAVMVIKIENDASDQKWEASTIAYPVVETVHEDSICKLVYAPARNVPESSMKKAQELARRAVAGLWGKGVFGVEMFLIEGDKLLVNEIAPRPHNSGHFTIEACPMSQYEAHIRAVLGLPIAVEDVMQDRNAVMLNILGGVSPHTHMRAAKRALSIRGAKLHMYGKGNGRPGRKMGHVTVVARSMDQAVKEIKPLVEVVDKIRAEREGNPTVDLKIEKPSPKNADLGKTRSATAPLVAITMGSDSDRFVMKPAVELLTRLQIPYQVTITSAHRTPQRMFDFARDAALKGYKVIIAGAGGAAHLPGMIAAITPLPVIGVPVKGSVLDGLDSLLSIVQMPRGCPVATVAINNSSNAAQLAVRILGVSDTAIRQRLEKYLDDQTQTVIAKAEKMETVGIENYSWEE